jgi:hypothetical protein
MVRFLSCLVIHQVTGFDRAQKAGRPSIAETNVRYVWPKGGGEAGLLSKHSSRAIYFVTEPSK